MVYVYVCVCGGGVEWRQAIPIHSIKEGVRGLGGGGGTNDPKPNQRLTLQQAEMIRRHPIRLADSDRQVQRMIDESLSIISGSTLLYTKNANVLSQNSDMYIGNH